jgi:hypothetical protein
MTREDVLRLAMEVGIMMRSHEYQDEPTKLEKFAALVAAHERETCAALCEQKVERPADYQGRFGGYGNFMGDKTGPECAAEIRARRGF